MQTLLQLWILGLTLLLQVGTCKTDLCVQATTVANQAITFAQDGLNSPQPAPIIIPQTEPVTPSVVETTSIPVIPEEMRIFANTQTFPNTGNRELQIKVQFFKNDQPQNTQVSFSRDDTGQSDKEPSSNAVFDIYDYDFASTTVHLSASDLSTDLQISSTTPLQQLIKITN